MEHEKLLAYDFTYDTKIELLFSKVNSFLIIELLL